MRSYLSKSAETKQRAEKEENIQQKEQNILDQLTDPDFKQKKNVRRNKKVQQAVP